MPAPDQPRPAKRKQLPAPKGTRDFYPEDLLRRRYIEKAWRDTSIRHGFEEIEGPTFETADLYKVKSGEGILGEMFGVFSGKAEEDLKHLRETGEAPLALRPEFTPTLARMYAARAAQLGRPTKWFTAGPYFRAEKPQRGRLREFCQWNVDFIGGDDLAQRRAGDLAVVECCADLFDGVGLKPSDVRLRLNNRLLTTAMLRFAGVEPAQDPPWFNLLDRATKIPEAAFLEAAVAIGTTPPTAARLQRVIAKKAQPISKGDDEVRGKFLTEIAGPQMLDPTKRWIFDDLYGPACSELNLLQQALQRTSHFAWLDVDASIVRGLAYYTGMVFEAIAEGERAVCGGGRYDNLIELFGGPPTPAVGFGMGDVVLGNLLQDKGLMPEGPALLEALSAPAARLRPDVFVVSNGSDEADAQVRPLVARLRRGEESEAWLSREGRKPWGKDRFGGTALQSGERTTGLETGATRAGAAPLHARHSYKATKNIGKLLEDARKSAARFAAIVENAEECSLKNLDTGEQRERVKLADLAAAVSPTPTSSHEPPNSLLQP
ncbi:MAG: ATP phosphoribosyltransferase regulatory subunit [Phycisphaerales bacterium]|nr:ATP phosphoribosyltransferase regulatory subunit [Phycisphaerales bacterium]